MKITKCKICGSTDVSVNIGVNPNGKQSIRDFCHEDETITEDGWCNTCNEYAELEMVDNPNENPWRCEECGSLRIERKGWFDPNTEKFIGYTECGKDDNWCYNCDGNTHQVQESELMGTINDWFHNHLEPDDPEVISSLSPGDYATEEEYDQACNDHWELLSNEEKISIWESLNHNE